MRLLMAAIGGVVVLLAGLVALSVAGPSAAYIAVALAAVYPNLWMNDGLLMAESLAVAGTAAAVWCTYRLIATWRRRWAAATGAACAVAMLSRSELALLVPVMVVPAVLFARTVPMSQRLAHAGLACATAAFVVAPGSSTTWAVSRSRSSYRMGTATCSAAPTATPPTTALF